jgi:hypothetical protein
LYYSGKWCDVEEVFPRQGCLPNIKSSIYTIRNYDPFSSKDRNNQYRATIKIGQHKNERFGIATGFADSGVVGLPVVVAYICYYTMISSISFLFSASFLFLFSCIATECQKHANFF